MIFISPKGMTITEWLKEKRRLNAARGHYGKGKSRERTGRGFAKKPLFGHNPFPFIFATMFLTRIFSRGKK